MKCDRCSRIRTHARSHQPNIRCDAPILRTSFFRPRGRYSLSQTCQLVEPIVPFSPRRRQRSILLGDRSLRRTPIAPGRDPKLLTRMKREESQLYVRAVCEKRSLTARDPPLQSIVKMGSARIWPRKKPPKPVAHDTVEATFVFRGDIPENSGSRTALFLFPLLFLFLSASAHRRMW